MGEDELSRTLARFFTGEDRLFSAICWERRWTGPKWFFLAVIVDDHFRRKRGEVNHCRSAYWRERQERAEMPARARWAGL